MSCSRRWCSAPQVAADVSSPPVVDLPPDILRAEVPSEGAIYGLGTFDGVHKGHLHLIDRVLAVKAVLGCPAWILVLYRDPANPLFAGQQVITTRAERGLLFQDTALDGASTLNLTSDVTSMTHEVFVREVLLRHLRARHLVVGWDFHYGHARVGNVSLLQAQLAASGSGCGLTMLDPVLDGDEPIKSTTIREWLLAGEIRRANRWLTRPFFALGNVVEGRRMGRELGFPTANLALPPEKLRPAPGVYVTVADTPTARCWAATNVGIRPTFSEASELTVESHLIGYEGDLYGQPLMLHFIERLRPELRFDSPGSLKAQIAADVAAIVAYAEETGMDQLGLPDWPVDLWASVLG